MKSVTDSHGRPLQLQNDIAGGGEARIWTIQGRPGEVAKIYHSPSPRHEAKLAAMIAKPPQQPQTHTAIAWPTDLLYAQRRFAGFLMPWIKDADLIFKFIIPANAANTRPVSTGAICIALC